MGDSLYQYPFGDIHFQGQCSRKFHLQSVKNTRHKGAILSLPGVQGHVCLCSSEDEPVTLNLISVNTKMVENERYEDVLNVESCWQGWQGDSALPGVLWRFVERDGSSQEMYMMLLWNIGVLFSEGQRQKRSCHNACFFHFCTITASGESRHQTAITDRKYEPY